MQTAQEILRDNAATILSQNERLFEEARKKGMAQVQTLTDALISLQLGRGFGRYEHKKIDHLESLKEFAVPAVINALTCLNGHESRIEEVMETIYYELLPQTLLADEFWTEKEAAEGRSVTARRGWETRDMNRAVKESSHIKDEPISITDVKSVFGGDGSQVLKVEFIRDAAAQTQPIEYKAFVQYERGVGGLAQLLDSSLANWGDEADDRLLLEVPVDRTVGNVFDLVVQSKNQLTGEVKNAVIPSSDFLD